MGLMIFKLSANLGVLAVATNENALSNRIFGLDTQLLVDTAILALSVFVLFLLLSYLLFNPARELIKKRRDKIQSEMELSLKEKEAAKQFKTEYETKLKRASIEADEILSEGRKKALKREDEIVNEAKEEANKIIERANREIELERTKLKDEVKQEVISVATLMAGKIIGKTIDEEKHNELIEDALNEMGDHTWQS